MTDQKTKSTTHTHAHATILQIVIFPYIPFSHFPAFSGEKSPPHIYPHRHSFVSKDKSRPVAVSAPFVLRFASVTSCQSVVAACWQEQVYFLIYFTRLWPKERSLRFSLILLKRPVLFRVELRKKTSRKVKCT